MVSAVLALCIFSLVVFVSTVAASKKNNPATATPAFVQERMSPSNSSKEQKWFPLESNPTLMNDYIRKLGFNTDLYQFVDVFSAEDWALEMIPQPVAAVIMLYPLTPKQLEHEKKDEATASDAEAAKADDSSSVWFIKQRIGNACGTIGLLHSLLNTPEPLNQFQPDSWLETFQASTASVKDPVTRAEILEGDTTIATLHDAATSSEQNQTSRGEIDDKVITHFVALVCRNNVLYELDGRKAGPVPHGSTTPATLLPDACKVIQEFMARDPDEIRFTILALAPKQE